MKNELKEMALASLRNRITVDLIKSAIETAVDRLDIESVIEDVVDNLTMDIDFEDMVDTYVTDRYDIDQLAMDVVCEKLDWSIDDSDVKQVIEDAVNDLF